MQATSRSSRSKDRAGADRSAAPRTDGLRMRDLVARSGLPRETIHFYLTQGLLPKPLKTGRNTAVYGQDHLERLQRIRDLQERHFLPLRAIREVLDEGAGGTFTEEQEVLLRRVRASLPAHRHTAASNTVAVSALVPSRVSRADFDAMRRFGFIEVHGRGAGARVGEDDAELLACWCELRTLEGPGEPALTPDLVSSYDDAMTTLVRREARALVERIAGMSGDRALELIETSEPMVLRMLGILRRKKIAALLEDFAPVPSKP
ncbi:MAG TPA: MerR family transcriptional regulator [Candidatus Binatia bacterium]|jgi:DNA-binding transcriptional MerR regulator